jgi:Ca2+-binding EF-hand superfamily protein
LTKAADTDGDGFISVSEVEKLLENIGAKDALTPDEIDDVMGEIGSKEGAKGVPIKSVVDYVKKSSKPGVA